MWFAGYEIDMSKVIGIGPLKVESVEDKAMKMLYNPLRYYFQIFFENYTAEISSDRLSTIGVDENLRKVNREKLTEFENAYVDVRAFIIDKISK